MWDFKRCFCAGKIEYGLTLFKDYASTESISQRNVSKKISTNSVAHQSFTNLTTIITGSSLSEEHDLRCLSWEVSFNVTAELEVNVDNNFAKICAAYNRDPQTEDQCTADKNCEYWFGVCFCTKHRSTEDQCTADENCQYVFGFCEKRRSKKALRTFRMPDPGRTV